MAADIFFKKKQKLGKKNNQKEKIYKDYINKEYDHSFYKS